MFYADAIESKMLVLQQAMRTNSIPENTRKRLSQNGVEIADNNGELALVYKNKTITAGDFVEEVNSNASLYAAINNATYDRAAYWYDEAAEKVFREIGTSRNNYTADSDFATVMSELMGEGSEIDVNSVEMIKKTTENGEEIDFTTVGANAESSADNFIEAVRTKTKASNEAEALLDSANTLSVADAISQEKRSSIFFLAFMENISKMQAGEGGSSKINEVMNWLYKESENQVVDTKTGEIVTVTGSMMESPSLYAILSGEKIDISKVGNYSSERVIDTVKNITGLEAGSDVFSGTITSTNGGSKVKGTIGRFVSGNALAPNETLNKVSLTISNSLVNNSFNDTAGIAGGELLVEGAVNVSRKLAMASGATAGDAASVKSYANLTSNVLALEAEADRLNKSPLDISSPNTFLGSFAWKLMGFSNNWIDGTKAYADNESQDYLENFGDCDRLGSAGAVGTASCSTIATFDTSTLDDTFNNPEFIKFVEENTTLENGTRQIKSNSVLADFIRYNNERKTPVGVMDGGILQAVNGGGNISFVTDIVSMIKNFLGSSDTAKRYASGAEFVNSASNPNWEKYKYAQRYVALARATEMLRGFDGDATAYNNILFFEGAENPVVAFIREDAILAALR